MDTICKKIDSNIIDIANHKKEILDKNIQTLSAITDKVIDNATRDDFNWKSKEFISFCVILFSSTFLTIGYFLSNIGNNTLWYWSVWVLTAYILVLFHYIRKNIKERNATRRSNEAK